MYKDFKVGETYLLKWKLKAYGGFQVQVNDLLNFLVPPQSCSNPYFMMEVFESPQPSQVATVKRGNGV